MHTSKVQHQKIIHIPPRSKYYPPPTTELLCYVHEQTTETTVTYLPHYRQWHDLDCCKFLLNGSCCPRMICRGTLPHHRSITLSHQSFSDVERMNFSSWPLSCSFRIAGATPNTTLGKAVSTSRATYSDSLKWCQYTICRMPNLASRRCIPTDLFNRQSICCQHLPD